jgi:hypothetical protein
MKKIFAMIALLLCMANSASAAWLTTANDGSVTIDAGGVATGLTLTAKVSANVTLGYTAGPSGVAYTVASYHSSGTKSYATSSADTRIYMADNGNNVTQTAVKAEPAITVSGTTLSIAWTGWTPVK